MSKTERTIGLIALAASLLCASALAKAALEPGITKTPENPGLDVAQSQAQGWFKSWLLRGASCAGVCSGGSSGG